MVRFGVIGTGRISDWVLKGAAQDPRIRVTDVHGSAILGYDGMEAILTWSKICDSFLPTEISGENGLLESSVNTHQTSLTVLEIMDELKDEALK